MLEDVEKKKRNTMKITAQEFDKKFDNYEDIDEFIDYENPMSLNEFKNKYFNDKVELTLTQTIKNKILEKSKQLGLSFEDTIKVLLARELKVI